MYSIESSAENIYEIKKSKFYSYVYPVFSESDIETHLSRLHIEHKDATHICYGYVTTNPNMERANDDGEPSGTAGKPILELIKKRDLKNVLLVVVRYFGGIKLGGGGLIRAYTTASSEVLDKTNVIEYGEYRDISITMTHSEYKDIKNMVDKDKSIYLLDTTFLNDVEMTISVRVDLLDKLKDKIISMLRKDTIKVLNSSIRIVR